MRRDRKTVKVEEFHEHVGSPPPTALSKTGGEIADAIHEGGMLKDVAERGLSAMAERLALAMKASQTRIGRVGPENVRTLRAELIISEAMEAVDALAERDEVALLDALCDLMYVIIGTAVAFGLPIDAGFDVVHASNMTKYASLESAAAHQGDRGKGPDYVPPDLVAVIVAERGMA